MDVKTVHRSAYGKAAQQVIKKFLVSSEAKSVDGGGKRSQVAKLLGFDRADVCAAVDEKITSHKIVWL